MTLNLKGIIICVTVLILSLLTNFYLYFLRKPEIITKERYIEVIKRDTVVKHDIQYDTVFFTNVNTEYKTMVLHDTAWIVDSAKEYRYEHTDYTFRANAVKLNNFDISVHRSDTITVEHTNTIEKTVVDRNGAIQFGIYAGLGFEINNRTINPEIGIGIVVPLTKFGKK